jgi:ABC-type transport system substrate-binding protein
MAHARGDSRAGRTNRAIAAAALMSVAIAFGSCRNLPAASGDATSGTLRVGTAQLSASNPIAGLRQLTPLLTAEGLVRVGEGGRLEPVLAEKWAVTNAGRSLLLTLRSGVKFHDGSLLDSTAVVQTLPDGLKSFWGSLAQNVEQIKPVDDRTVEITFRRASPMWQEMLEVTMRKQGGSIGTGPFAAAQNSSTLRANADYYLGSPRINEVQVTSFPTVRAAWAELLRNRIDMLWEVGTDALDSLQSSTTVAVFAYTRHYQYVLAFNPHTPALRSSAVRRALNMAIDRVSLVERALNGHGLPSSGPIWPRYWALPTPLPSFEFDPSRAAKLLNTAGSVKSAVRFTCLIPADAIYERLALEVRRQLQTVGVEMDVQAVPTDQLLEAERSRRFDAVLIDFVSGPTLLRVSLVWDSRSEINLGGLGNPTVDSAFDRVGQVEDEAAYRQAVGRLQQAFLDDPPAIFLAWSERARAISKRFAVPPPEAGRDVLGTIRLWSPRNNDARLASRN